MVFSLHIGTVLGIAGALAAANIAFLLFMLRYSAKAIKHADQLRQTAETNWRNLEATTKEQKKSGELLRDNQDELAKVQNDQLVEAREEALEASRLKSE